MTTTHLLPSRAPGLRHGVRPRLVASLAFVAAAILAGCGGAPAPSAAPEAYAPPPSPAPMADAPAGLAAGDEQREEVAPTAAAAQETSIPTRVAGPLPTPSPRPAAAAGAKSSDGDDVEVSAAPMIVYQGELALRVDAGQGPEAIDAVVTLAETLGGHLAGRDDGRVVVKIPSRRFREAMSQVDAEFEVERRNVRAEDVTSEFKDLEVRLDNLRATRKRLEQLLEKTGSLADTLTVEKELERVASEIDRIQGRIRFLRSHTSFSTLTVAVAERAKSTPVVVATNPPAPRRDLAIPLPWVDRLGVDALVHIPAEE